MIEAGALLWFVIWLMVVGAIFCLLVWAVGQTERSEQFKRRTRIGLALVAVFILISWLTGIIGTPIFR